MTTNFGGLAIERTSIDFKKKLWDYVLIHALWELIRGAAQRWFFTFLGLNPGWDDDRRGLWKGPGEAQR
jgi:hypothetical protein